MATTSIRVATIAALRTLVETAVDTAEGDTDVAVYFGRPDREAARDSISVGVNLEGTLEFDELSAGRKRRLDAFTFDVVIFAAMPGRTYQEAAARAEALWAHVENVTANDPTLGNLGGLLWCITQGAYSGPQADPTDEGFLAVVVGTCECEARLE